MTMRYLIKLMVMEAHEMELLKNKNVHVVLQTLQKQRRRFLLISFFVFQAIVTVKINSIVCVYLCVISNITDSEPKMC